ncbi:hypothetical protein OMW55_03235 [Sphingomonas sp. BN140010]|uniref:Antifreeze glycopeptide polyprotein n=1 Tax=Sphingomonas arvum TaxID=2992113 RepID=A0ABT3JD30_9SPHN|nr:hypothetical protein [Sphingomonas sp. BN140010]MCW3796819.1 hypothetical protein [Sphingomonas sp. BN140010]
MASRAKLLLLTGLAGVALAPALAQEVILPPGFGNETTPAPTPQPASNLTDSAERPAAARPRPRPAATAEGGELVESDELTEAELAPPPPPVEIPDESRRDPRRAGVLDPTRWGYGENPWGAADGRFLSGLLRRQSTPLPSRWLLITLRNALLTRAEAPFGVNGADWTAERAWLLLRMGEADAAGMLVSGVDVDDFTPKLTQVAVQTALATADPAGLCPLRDKMAGSEARILPLAQAICSALDGEGASAAAQIQQARRRGRIGGIDLVLADKVVGAGEGTGRAATVEWEPVDTLTSWRFGLAAATGLMPPDRLMTAASPQVRAWAARAPLFSPEARLPFARTAAGLGVLSSSALVDLYSQIYDATDPSDLPGTDAWRLRTAFVGRDSNARLAAMRELWRQGDGELERQASRAMLSLAATRITPNPELGDDAVNLVASMLAGGYDKQAARWARAVGQMDGAAGDRAWALLALGTEADVDVSSSRIEDFIGRDDSRDKQRSKLLVAGLVGTGRISAEEASRLGQRNELGLGGTSVWTRLVDGAGQRRQAGTAVVLGAIGLQAPSFTRVPAAQLLHALNAMRLAGLGYNARMIAAEALART